MNQLKFLSSSSFLEEIEGQFKDIAKNHLEYWSDNKNQLYEIDTFYTSTFGKTNNGGLYRPKRSGIEKILQVIQDKCSE